jgi:hypothetical protein
MYIYKKRREDEKKPMAWTRKLEFWMVGGNRSVAVRKLVLYFVSVRVGVRSSQDYARADAW